MHEAIDGNLGSITESTYLENPDFRLDPALAKIVTLIGNTRRPDLIPLWIPQAAIAVALDQPNPQTYCSLFLSLASEADEELLLRLKQTKWLPLRSGSVVAPENVILLPKQLLEKLEQGLESVLYTEKSSYVTLSMLAVDNSNSDGLKKICSTWYENDVLKFLLEETNQPATYCSLILATLKILLKRNQTISKENFERLKKTLWLVDRRGRNLSPQKVIYFPPLEKEANKILEQLEQWDCVTPALLEHDINFCLERLQEIFITNSHAIEEIGNALEQLPSYHLGKFYQEDFPLDRFLKVFQHFESFPVLKIAEKILKADFKKYILPKILCLLDSDEKLINIFHWIAIKNENPSQDAIAIYDKYLELACRSLQFEQAILPRIQLLNSANKWKSPEELCDGSRYTGIDEEYILRNDRQEFLSLWLNRISSTNIDTSVEEKANLVKKDAKSNAQCLEEYFRPWLSYVSSEAIGGFLCLLAGTNPEIQKLAKRYLRRRDFDDLRKRLLWSNVAKEKNFTISILASDSNSVQLTNLCGRLFHAQKLQDIVPDRLFVGELTEKTTHIHLAAIQINESISHRLPTILLESARIFIERICETQTNNESLNDIWQDISTSKQIDIRVAKTFILKSLFYVLRTLEIKDFKIRNCLQQWDDAEHASCERMQRNIEVTDINYNTDRIAQELENLIETNEDVRQAILEAVRRKISYGQYGYDPTSIPFELFQNADDSLAELKKMLGNTSLHPARLRYVLAWSSECLTVMHWGRPINLFTHPDAGDRDFRKEGFERDLIKMLSFNISDKTDGTTGKFGLGFKTVHLISKEPIAISGDLSFAIHAGLLPFALPRRNREGKDEQLLESLRDRLKSEQVSPHMTDGTLIDIPIDPKTNTNLSEVVSEFESKVGLLLVFAKFIKTCKLIGSSSPKQPFTWSPANVLGISGIEIGQVNILQDKLTSREWNIYNLLCFRIKDASLAIALPTKLSNGDSPLSVLPTFWATAPTKERLGLRFVVNGMFDVTTGRTSLDRNSARNLKIAEEIGWGLGEKLCELFNQSNSNWNALHQALGIEQADEYSFWEFLWNVLVIDWLEKKDSEDTTVAIVRTALGSVYCGIGYLIANHAALPNGLYGEKYRRLVLPQDVSYIVEGIMAEEECFKKVATWTKFCQKYSPARIIISSIWQSVKKLLGTDIPARPEKLQFANVVAGELGNK